jgi:hypothetical protein
MVRVIIVAMGTVLLMPWVSEAQTVQTTAANPPIAQPLVREGDLAVKLVGVLNLGAAANETEAESILGSAGIAPRNGWIADYPVTPDIIGELQQSISDAADSKRLSMSRDEALKALQDVTAESNLSVKPYTPDQTAGNPESYENYPNPDVINNYYATQGPPVVTYYAPPPDYFYLYAWVPYPFWWYGFWFPGFFCLHDFHRVVIINKRVVVISNHFVDPRTNRVYRIGPAARFKGRTYAGIGAPRSRGLVTPGGRGGATRIFSGSHEKAGVGRTYGHPSHEAKPPAQRSGARGSRGKQGK